MRIRHIPLYALAAGALVVSAVIFGAGDGADAATGAVTDAVHDAVAGATALADPSHAVVVRPETVAPGTAFSVFDGGNCRGETAEASFGGADIPAMRLSSLSSQIGGSAIMPEGIAPGAYTVTVTCGQAGRAPGGSGDRQRVTDRGAAEHGGEQRADGGARSGAPSPASPQTFTGTVTVSDGADEPVPQSGDESIPQGDDDLVPQGGDEAVPQGGSRTGLGGAAGTGRAATALGGALLLAAVGWGALSHRRRARGPQGARR